jgi:hypothetical protein
MFGSVRIYGHGLILLGYEAEGSMPCGVNMASLKTADDGSVGLELSVGPQQEAWAVLQHVLGVMVVYICFFH